MFRGMVDPLADDLILSASCQTSSAAIGWQLVLQAVQVLSALWSSKVWFQLHQALLTTVTKFVDKKSFRHHQCGAARRNKSRSSRTTQHVYPMPTGSDAYRVSSTVRPIRATFFNSCFVLILKVGDSHLFAYRHCVCPCTSRMIIVWWVSQPGKPQN